VKIVNLVGMWTNPAGSMELTRVTFGKRARGNGGRKCRSNTTADVHLRRHLRFRVKSQRMAGNNWSAACVGTGSVPGVGGSEAEFGLVNRTCGLFDY